MTRCRAEGNSDCSGPSIPIPVAVVALLVLTFVVGGTVASYSKVGGSAIHSGDALLTPNQESPGYPCCPGGGGGGGGGNPQPVTVDFAVYGGEGSITIQGQNVPNNGYLTLDYEYSYSIACNVGSGYVFHGWSSSADSFTNPSACDTTFTVSSAESAWVSEILGMSSANWAGYAFDSTYNLNGVSGVITVPTTQYDTISGASSPDELAFEWAGYGGGGVPGTNIWQAGVAEFWTGPSFLYYFAFYQNYPGPIYCTYSGSSPPSFYSQVGCRPIATTWTPRAGDDISVSLTAWESGNLGNFSVCDQSQSNACFGLSYQILQYPVHEQSVEWIAENNIPAGFPLPDITSGIQFYTTQVQSENPGGVSTTENVGAGLALLYFFASASPAPGVYQTLTPGNFGSGFTVSYSQT